MKINVSFNTDLYTPLEIIAILYAMNRPQHFKQFCRLYRYACKVYGRDWVYNRLNDMAQFFAK